MSQSQQLAGSEFPHLLAVSVSLWLDERESEGGVVLVVSQDTEGIEALVVSVGSWSVGTCLDTAVRALRMEAEDKPDSAPLKIILCSADPLPPAV